MSGRRLTEAERLSIAERYAEGRSREQIARRLRCSKRTVHYWLGGKPALLAQDKARRAARQHGLDDRTMTEG